jgi:hypothetical protein
MLTLLLTASLLSPHELWPGARYDPAVPTAGQVLGHGLGDEITSAEGIATYLQALAGAAPDRTRLVEYARSWEGRPLHVLIIGSADRMHEIDALQADLKRLADPRPLSEQDAEGLVKRLPVVVWLMAAVHGDEISSSEAVLALAYHLLAVRKDAAANLIQRDAVVLIDPLQNPDGRTRFLQHYLQSRAASPDLEPNAVEHDEPWPSGRYNHYLFDMNRDWFAQTQPETAGRVRVYLDWYPQVVVDLHEMGAESSYYFAPPAVPENPHITPQQHSWLEAFGRANAQRFDERGFAYFVREVFDSFYPGYGESWPMFQGAIGMTYEQASAGGLRVRRHDGTELSFRQGVVHHFTAALTTALTAAQNRQRLLRDFLEYRRSAAEEGRTGVVEYLLPPGNDPSRCEALARLLVTQGVEVRRTEAAAKAGSQTLPEGTFVVPLAQPSGRLVRNLLAAQIPMDPDFVRRQRDRVEQRQRDEIYDMSGWSLPLLWDVDAVEATRPIAAPQAEFVGERTPAGPLAPARVGYLVPWSSAAAAGVADALQAGLKARSAAKPFKLNGRDYAGGAVLFRTSDNGADLGERLQAAAERHHMRVDPVDSGWVDEGISLGSNQVRPLKAPRVLLAWDQPTWSMSAGWARFVLERRFSQPVTAVRVATLPQVELARFDVLVLPSGRYQETLGEEDVARIRAWVSDGGTLVTLGEASRWAARQDVGLLETATELRDGRPESGEEGKEKAALDKPREPEHPFDLEAALRPERERPATTPGALLRVELDFDHWLSAGTDGEIQVVVDSQRVFTPIRLDKGRNVGLYVDEESLVASGLTFDDSRAALARKAYLIDQPIGEGHLIAFAEDPNYRAFAEATELLFMNAVLLGPAH